MIKVRNLTESLEKKYNLDEDSAPIEELSFNDIMDQEIPTGDMGWYAEDHPNWTQESDYIKEDYEDGWEIPKNEIKDNFLTLSNDPYAPDPFQWEYDYLGSDKTPDELTQKVVGILRLKGFEVGDNVKNWPELVADELSEEEMLNLMAAGCKIIDNGDKYIITDEEILDERYEYESEEEIDDILYDDSLTDEEKKQAIDDIYSRYKSNGDWYNESFKNSKANKPLTEAYRFKPIPEDPDMWGCDTDEEFQEILNLEGEEIVNIVKATNGAPYYDITFANGEKLFGVAQNCIYMSTDESLQEDVKNKEPKYYIVAKFNSSLHLDKYKDYEGKYLHWDFNSYAPWFHESPEFAFLFDIDNYKKEFEYELSMFNNNHWPFYLPEDEFEFEVYCPSINEKKTLGSVDDFKEQLRHYNESLHEDWYDEDKYSLVGQDGNAFALMGYTAKCMKECGLRDEISKMREEAMSSDYNNLICVCDSYVQKCNDIARDMGESLNEDTINATTDMINTYMKANGEKPGTDAQYFSGTLDNDDVYDYRTEESKSLRPYSDQYKYLQAVKHGPEWEEAHTGNKYSDFGDMSEMELMAARSHAHQAQKNLLSRARSKHPKNESLNESIAGDIIFEKVEDIIREKIQSEIIDNLAVVISAEVPEYNPDWCTDSSNASNIAADKLANELATDLMFNLE